MIILNNVYAIDIQKLIDFMDANPEYKENEEIKSIYDRMASDLHWIKLGKK